MIHAIRNNKAGRNFRDATDWRSLFGSSEDSLTSSVLGHLFYLPPSLLWRVIRSAVPSLSECLTGPCPVVKSYEFWPHWDATGTRNVLYIEPDVFIRTDRFDLLVEAKRFDYDQQDPAQWRDQFLAYQNEHGHEGKEVALLAVGGIYWGEEEATHIALDCGDRGMIRHTVHKCRWQNLLVSVLEQQALLQVDGATDGHQHIVFLLADIVNSFGLHGYTSRPLFNTLPPAQRPLLKGRGLQLLLQAAGQPTT